MHRVLFLLVLAHALLAQNPNTAKFPGALATDQDLLVAKDQSASTLSAAIGAADTAIPVASGAQFTAYEVVTIDAEQVLICSVVSNTLNVCPGGRGFAGTPAANHVSGATVRGHITAWHHNQVAAETKAIQSQLGANLANVVKTGTAYGDPSWISSLAGSKISGGISGNAGTATALAANGINCPAGQAALGVDASGNAEGCYDPASYRAKQINFVYGGSASAFIDATTVHNLWRSHAHTATVSEIACWTDAGTVTLNILRSDGASIPTAVLTCSTSGASTTSLNATNKVVGAGYGIGFQTSGVSGVKSLSVSIKYTPSN